MRQRAILSRHGFAFLHLDASLLGVCLHPALRSAQSQFLEAKLGSVPHDGWHAGKAVKAGNAITWSIDEVRRGVWELTDAEGEVTSISWLEAALDPGWVKLDWVARTLSFLELVTGAWPVGLKAGLRFRSANPSIGWSGCRSNRLPSA